jgi:ATP-binding cassette subfamily B protein
MSAELQKLLWRRDQLLDALLALSRRLGGVSDAGTLRAPVRESASEAEQASRENVASFVEVTTRSLGLEAERLEVAHADVPRLLYASGPWLMEPTVHGQRGHLLLLGARGRHTRVLAPDRRIHRVSHRALRHLLCAASEAQVGVRLGPLFDQAQLAPARRARVTAQLARETLAATIVAHGFLVRLGRGQSFRAQLRAAHVPRRLVTHLTVFAASLGLHVLAFWLVGRGALSGRLDWGFLSAFLLALLSAVPLSALATWTAGMVSIDVGALLKARMLAGALSLDPESVRSQGAGAHLSRVIESEEVEALALNAGFAGATGVLEWLAGAFILGLGPAPLLSLTVLGAATLAMLALSVLAYRARKRWTGTRLGMTERLIERMVGHRTRLAQELPGHYHREEDGELEAYLHGSRSLDAREVAVEVLAARGYLVLGVATLLPSFVAGALPPTLFAVGLGGVLMSQRALSRLSLGLGSLAAASIAFRNIRPLFAAAAHAPLPTAIELDTTFASAPAVEPGRPLLSARNMLFQHAGRTAPTLRNVSIDIAQGDRVLLEGRSGGGKSTLGALLSGLREPHSGLLLLAGLDRRTLGADAFRKQVVSVPQFHDNHLLSSTLAFNVLMGREWPCPQADIDEAAALLTELGLGPLLARMPSGMMQMVGETGWQLSHGERSRVYLARALLSRARMVVLDESFAALDPATMQVAIDVTLARAPTLLLIAHP